MRWAKLVVLSAVVAACGSSTSSGPPGQGGVSGSGGSIASGGSTSTASGSGGASSTGGSVASGGTSGSGGASTTAAGGATGPANGGTAAGGGSGSGGASTAADGGPADGRRDGSAMGSGGSTGGGGSASGGAGTGGASGTGGAGTGGARADAGPDARPDAAADLRRFDSIPDRGGGSDALTSDGAPCLHAGHVTYTLARSANPTAAEQQAYDLIVPAMDEAVSYYNCYTDITKAVSVSYNASVSTADGNINGSIRFGGTQYMEYITAMHEIAHTVGVGTASNWRSFVAIPDGGTSGPWTGSNATAELRAITGKATDTLTADTQHFWPYGLNYTSEVKSEADVIDHCRIVVALRKDMGM